MTLDPLTLTDPTIVRNHRSLEAQWPHPDKAFEKHGDTMTPVTVLSVTHDKERKEYTVSMSLESHGRGFRELLIGRSHYVTIKHTPAARFSAKRLEEIFAEARSDLPGWIEEYVPVRLLWNGEKIT